MIKDTEIKDKKKLEDVIRDSNVYNSVMKQVGVSPLLADRFAPKLGVSN